jgi:hypothetical protein
MARERRGEKTGTEDKELRMSWRVRMTERDGGYI